ncbi:DgyrCDS8938 [Dimorphilus gyrociliatus]|uniref:DgyrCDS8938 n=1 Tax=Dimorphilus gyrociliatus TaxID=2664684 RepID=A0A7I8W0T2_9ANNE|nr:DgyrCDS8938 [Dimorphilus gyrociliatus]
MSSDKDYRFMATNDLISELQKDSIKLDDDSERKVVKMVLRLLEDKNGEVQNLAVKCLGPLVNKVKDNQVEVIVDTLCTNMVSDKEQLRDISTIGMKTVISDMPIGSSTFAATISRKITGKLTTAISKEDISVQLEALDILHDLLHKFGQLVLCSSSALFSELMEFLLQKLCNDTPTTRTYIQCVGAIARHAGHKVGKYLDKIMPAVVNYCKQDDDEVREFCLQAFESFVIRCPKEVTPHINQIIDLCLKYITYDPNYNYDDDDENEDEHMMDTDEDIEEDDDDYSDDDDMSWKVRRASAKCLEAVIRTRHEMLGQLHTTVSPALIGRFKEREDNVKADVFHAYMCLLKQTRPATVSDPDAMDQDGNPINELQDHLPNLVKAVYRQFRQKSIKTRQCCFALLTELVTVLPGCLSPYIQMLIPGIQFSLGDKNTSSNMKIDTLSFLNCLLVNHQPSDFHPHIEVLVPLVIGSVDDAFYKIISEALLVTQQLVKVIRPLGEPVKFDYKPYVDTLYKSTLARLVAADIDQEVKERAISCMAQIVHSLGDALGAHFKQCLPIFVERLRNEITRLTTVKGVTLIASSPLKIDLSKVLNDILPILATFLRKHHRALRLSTQQCLETIVRNYGHLFSANLLNDVLNELPPLISESDLHMSQMTMTLLTTVSEINKTFLDKMAANILPQVMLLIRSPLLQGAALYSVLSFLQGIVKAEVHNCSYKELFTLLIKPVDEASEKARAPTILHKQAHQSISKAVAAITAASPKNISHTVDYCIAEIKSSKSDIKKLIVLLSLGELGRLIDLSGVKGVQDLILECFSIGHSDDIKTAAAYSLGSMCVGNLPKLLPGVIELIEKQPKRQYLLLHSLKEIISFQSVNPEAVDALRPFVKSIWQMLMNHAECEEEGTRNVVAECLGKLTLIDPLNLLPELEKYLKSSSGLVRATVVTAIKFTITDHAQKIDGLLKKSIGAFLNSLCDKDLNVRRVALVTFNSAAHNKPALIRDLLPKVLSSLYDETVVKKELIREVEMGPFKHTVDDGLDVRKAAFECMYTLLDSCLDRLDIFEFLKHLEDGLNDHYDIKMLSYLMLVRLSVLSPSALLQHLDRIIEPLKSTCTLKLKQNAVKQEHEKQDELRRSALRAVAAILKIPDADKSQQMTEFMNQIKASTELLQMFEFVQKDSTPPGQDHTSMDIY